MPSDWANLTGRIQTTFDLKALATKLATTGLEVEVATRYFATPVDYIRIHDGDDFTVQQVSSDHYLAEGLSSSVERMYAAASRVSLALTGLGIRHRFEVRDEGSRVVHCIHHHWPHAEDEFP